MYFCRSKNIIKMKRLLLFIAVLFFVNLTFAQQEQKSPYSTDLSDTTALADCDSLPSFIGGEKSLYLYVGQQMRKVCAYGEVDEKADLMVAFIVERDGKVSNFRPIDENPKYAKVYERMEKIFTRMPAWTPGMKDGKAVRCNIEMPLHLHWQSGNGTGSCTK